MIVEFSVLPVSRYRLKDRNTLYYAMKYLSTIVPLKFDRKCTL